MTKKIVLIFAVIFLCAFSFASFSDEESGLFFSSRESAMGYTGAAVNSGNYNYFANPASLYFYSEKSTFYLDVNTFDDIFERSNGFRLPMQPRAALSGQFIGKNASMTIRTGFKAEALSVEEESALRVPYRFMKDADIDVVLAVGRKNIAAGLGIKAGSGRYLTTDIRSDNKFADIITKGLFSRAERETNLTHLNLRFGVGYKLDRWTFGLLFDNALDTRVTTDIKEYRLDNLKNAAGIGVGFSTEEFTKRGRLNTFVVKANAEFWHFLSPVEASIRAGVEGKIQFEKSWSFSVLGGVRMPASNISEGVSTFGVQSRINDFNIYINTEIPFDWYTVKNVDSNSVIPVTVGLTYLY